MASCGSSTLCVQEEQTHSFCWCGSGPLNPRCPRASDTRWEVLDSPIPAQAQGELGLPSLRIPLTGPQGWKQYSGGLWGRSSGPIPAPPTPLTLPPPTHTAASGRPFTKPLRNDSGGLRCSGRSKLGRKEVCIPVPSGEVLELARGPWGF